MAIVDQIFTRWKTLHVPRDVLGWASRFGMLPEYPKPVDDAVNKLVGYLHAGPIRPVEENIFEILLGVFRNAIAH
jgi:hypothetical protein